MEEREFSVFFFFFYLFFEVQRLYGMKGSVGSLMMLKDEQGWVEI